MSSKHGGKKRKNPPRPQSAVTVQCGRFKAGLGWCQKRAKHPGQCKYCWKTVN